MRRLMILAVLCAAGSSGAAPIAGQGTWESVLQARDIDRDGIVDGWYDSAIEKTWLNGVRHDFMGLPADGGVGSGPATGAETYKFYGVGGWRLPSVADFNQLWSVTLGNAAGLSFNSGNIAFLDPGPFNQQPLFWTSQSAKFRAECGGGVIYVCYLVPDLNGPYTEFFRYNLRGGGGFYDTVDQRPPTFTMAMFDGDVAIAAAAVPEPSTYAFMTLGLLALGVVRRRAKSVSR